jgi:hypothetical protein
MRKKGYSTHQVAEKFGVGRSTVFDIMKQQDKILKFVTDGETDCSSRKSMRPPRHEALDRSLYMWFTHERSNGTPVSGPLLMEKARLLYKSLHPESESDFKASSGWLQCFKERHGIRLQGEPLTTNHGDVGKKLNELIKIHQLTLDQVFSCDVTRLFWRVLPEEALAPDFEESGRALETSRDMVAVLAAANVTGEFRLPLMVIGKSRCPLALRNINKSALPVRYAYQKDAQLDEPLFRFWFLDQFVPEITAYFHERKLPCKAILLLGGATSHPSTTNLQTPDGNIRCVFLPTNVTTIFQPMDKEVLKNLIRRYRCSLLKKLLLSLEDHGGSDVFIELLNIKDCIYMVAKAWEDIRQESLSRSWKKLLATSSAVMETQNSDVDESLMDMGEHLSLSHEAMEHWLETEHFLADEENFEDNEADSNQEPFTSLQGDSEILEVDHSDAVSAFDTCIQYLEHQPDTNSAELMLIYKLRESAAARRVTSLTNLF